MMTDADELKRPYEEFDMSLDYRTTVSDFHLRELEIDTAAGYLRDGMTILDVGCGLGYAVSQYASRFQVTAHGVDYSQNMVEGARTLLQQSFPALRTRVEFRNASVTTLRYSDDSFQGGLKPLRHPWGIWEMPIYYMDNMDFCLPMNWPDHAHVPFNPEVIRMALEEHGLYVFDFRALHIALNTRCHSDYLSVKERILSHGVSHFEAPFEGRGVRTFFLELCSAMQERRQYFLGCWDVLEKLECR